MHETKVVVSAGLEFVPKFDVTRRMRGGWFCSPEEYESMGFTLGLPPGIYLEQTQEISELVEKIKPINGMVMPSFYSNQSIGHRENRNIVLISDVPLDVTSDEIINELNRRIIEAKIFPQANEAENPSFIISCQIVRTHFLAYVKMISTYITEKAVNLDHLKINDNILPISLPDFIMKDASPLDKIYTTIHENQLCVVVEVDYKKFNKKIMNTIQLPSETAISNYFGQFYKINRIFHPEESRFVLLYMENLHDVDMIMINHKNCIIENIPVTIHRSFREQEDAERYIDQPMKDKIIKELGTSEYLTALSPYMNQENSLPSVADIFDLSMPINSLIRKETQELQPATGKYLLIFNVVKMSVFESQDLQEDIKKNVGIECNKFGKVTNLSFGTYFNEQLSCDNAVVCVSFLTPEDAKNAQIGISGRKFRGRIVITQIVDDEPNFEEK